MQVYYHRKDDSTRDYTADQITDWTKVVSVHIALLLDSIEAVNTEPQSYTFLGKTYTAADRRLHREWDTVIALREHL